MKILGLLLAIAGACQCLQAPLHYKYNYVGSAITGIPELSNQASGWFMKATVNVYLENDDGTAIFQLEDFKVAEFNEDLNCDFRGDIPDSLFHPFDDQAIANAVQAPFKAVLYNYVDHAIDSPEDGYSWLPNMRKGVASMFKNEILRSNLHDQAEGSIAAALHQGNLVNVFSVKEYTMFGKCQVDYTIYPIPEYFAGTKNREFEHEIKEDVQRHESTKSDAPQLEDGLWHVVRSIDFDHCSDRVAIQITPIWFRKDASVSQYKWTRSRSSVSEYIFRGSAGHFRIEKAFVEGSTTKAPLGLKSEYLQARVNQTLTLVSVTHETKRPSLSNNLHQSKTWMYEVYSSAATPKESKPHPWVIYTGKGHNEGFLERFGAAPLSADQYKLLKDSIIEDVESASQKLADLEQEAPTEKPGVLVEKLYSSSYIFKSLSKENILDIFEPFFAKSLDDHDILAKKLIIDVAAASGSSFAYDAILDYIKAGKITDLQIMTLFMALPNNAASPTIIPAILDYVLSLDLKEKPFLASTAVVNFAELVNRMCFSPNARTVHYTGAMYGDGGCDVDLIMDRFLPFLKNKIYNEESEWEREIAVYTLWALGSPLALPILAPIIEGRVKCSKSLRISAIYAVESWQFIGFENVKDQVTDLLTDVYSDIGENLEVRIAAVTNAASYSPKASVWQRLASSTWREPSKHFATYVTSLIESYANAFYPRYEKLAQVASHALKHAKPFAPSLKYSALQVTTSEMVEKHYYKMEGLNWITTEQGFNPKQLYALLLENFGGLQSVTLEVFARRNEGFFEIIRNKLRKDEKLGRVSGIVAKAAQKFYDEIQESIKSVPMNPHKPYFAEIFVKMFNRMHLILPINEETLTAAGFLDSTKLAELAVHLGIGHNLVLGKFFVPVDLESAHPTELGLPLFSHSSLPTILTGVSHSSIGFAGQNFDLDSLKKLEISTESLTSLAVEAQYSLQIVLPWSRKSVVTLSRSAREVTVPLKTVASREYVESDDGHQDRLQIETSGLYKAKFDAVRAFNTPATGVVPIYTPLKAYSTLSLKPLAQKSAMTKVIQLDNRYTGIDSKLTWKSRMGFPFSFQNLAAFARQPKALRSTPWLSYVIGSPTLEMWSASLEIDPATSETKSVTTLIESGVLGKAGGDKDASERTKNLLQQLEGTATTTSVKFRFNGQTNRDYEVVYAHSKEKLNDDRKVQKSHISIIRSPIPHVDDKSASICINVDKASPAFSKLDTVESLLEGNLDKVMEAEVLLDCKDDAVVKAKGSYHITPEGKAQLKKDITESCDYDPLDPLRSFHSLALYNDLDVSVTWNREIDSTRFPVASTALKLGNGVMDISFLDEDCASSGGKRNLEIAIDRCLESGNWYFDFKQKDSHVKLESIAHNQALDCLFSIGKKKESSSNSDLSSTSTSDSDKCYVGSHTIRTFDGFVYDYEPTNCWTVAAKDCYDEHGWILLVRSASDGSAIPEAKFVDAERGLIVEYSHHVIKVNGKAAHPDEVVTDSEGRILVAVQKKNDFFLVKFFDKFYVALKNNIEIHVPDSMYGHMCGLCGDYNREKDDDLVGPHRCFFDDIKLFVNSWTAPSDSCDSSTVKDLRKSAETFQKTCSTIESLHDKCPHFNERCYKYEYLVQKEGTAESCVSVSPVPHCDDGCKVFESDLKPVEFRCWPDAHAPEALSAALAKGESYIGTPIVAEAYHDHVFHYITIPRLCKNF